MSEELIKEEDWLTKWFNLHRATPNHFYDGVLMLHMRRTIKAAIEGNWEAWDICIHMLKTMLKYYNPNTKVKE